MVRYLAIVAASLLVCACGATQAPAPSPVAPAPQTAKAPPSGAPPALSQLAAQSNALLGGGKQAFDAELARLRGYPVVVNKWASWCPPCRGEFGLFQKQSQARGSQVAFLGLDSNDSSGDARNFLRQFPVSYPHFSDPDGAIAASINAGTVFPTTVFFDASGHIFYVKQGDYTDEQSLARDIDRYAR